MLAAFERSVGVSISTDKLVRVFLPLSDAASKYAIYLTPIMNFRFKGAALLQLPDGLWKHAQTDVPTTVAAFQSAALPTIAQLSKTLQKLNQMMR